jgi:aminoglycoside phosphotransferase (APT) family kinase protein
VIEDLLAQAGIDPDQVADAAALEGGTFNNVSRVTLTNGQRLILKAAPDIPTLTYEWRILRTEALYYELAGPHRNVPAVIHTGFDAHNDAGDFILMTEIPGRPWPSVADQFGADQRQNLRRDLGRIVAGLHTITGTGFGYPARPLAASWRSAFSGMVEDLLADADRYGAVLLPRPPEDIRGLIAAHESVLDVVTTPVLVHFDLWDGNILVDSDGAGSPRIGGLIDAERAFWGDPLAEFVSLALLADINDDPAFLAGYRDAGGPASLDASSRIRLALYRAYLYLIMLIEAEPRGFGPAQREWLERRVAPALTTALEVLAFPRALALARDAAPGHGGRPGLRLTVGRQFGLPRDRPGFRLLLASGVRRRLTVGGQALLVKLIRLRQGICLSHEVDMVWSAGGRHARACCEHCNDGQCKGEAECDQRASPHKLLPILPCLPKCCSFAGTGKITAGRCRSAVDPQAP